MRHVVAVPYGPHTVPDAMTWDELLAADPAQRTRLTSGEVPVEVALEELLARRPSAQVIPSIEGAPEDTYRLLLESLPGGTRR